MNEVFLIGKIICEVEYKFMLEKNKTAKAILKLELIDKTEIYAVAYNEIADLCYSNFRRGNIVIIYGKITNNTIEIKDIEIDGTFSHFFTLDIITFLS